MRKPYEKSLDTGTGRSTHKSRLADRRCLAVLLLLWGCLVIFVIWGKSLRFPVRFVSAPEAVTTKLAAPTDATADAAGDFVTPKQRTRWQRHEPIDLSCRSNGDMHLLARLPHGTVLGAHCGSCAMLPGLQGIQGPEVQNEEGDEEGEEGGAHNRGSAEAAAKEAEAPLFPASVPVCAAALAAGVVQEDTRSALLAVEIVELGAAAAATAAQGRGTGATLAC